MKHGLLVSADNENVVAQHPANEKTAPREICTQGSSFDMNQCLRRHMSLADDNLAKNKAISEQAHKEFSALRKSLCMLSSRRYKGGTFAPIAYGHCYISLSEWFAKQMQP